VAEAQAKRPKRAVALSPWEKAVAARAEFEASPADEHTKATYTHVMDGFRAIYHDDPGDQHAAEAVANVAELLTEQGRELGDAASLKNAAGQYRFLEEQYPQSRAAREAKTRLTELERGAVAAPSSALGMVPAPKADSSASLRNDKKVSGRALAQVTGIRHWSTATYTRVAIDLGGEVTFEAARVPNPDRIYFDLHGAKLTPELAGKSFAVTDDGFLKRIRAAQAGADVTRVVLDVNDVTDYSAFLLPNPYRLIIDIHGGNRAQGPGLRAQEVPIMPSTPVAATDSVRASAAANASGLPAMAPTDGGLAVRPALVAASSTEGRTLAADSHVSEARHGAPSTVIAPKMVPGAVGVKAPAATAEVAAVSNEPGKVEATSAPTSNPIAAGVPVATSVNLGSGKRSKRVRPADGVVVSDALPAAPAKAAEKTADGETSMIRALGLKIGRIVIDAGHGGHDSGTLGADGIEEKDVVLDVALRLGKLLHDRLGAEIIYTRSDDTFIPLETRTAIANKAQADLFISIHANSSQDATARGVETYYLNFTSDPSALDVAARENAVGGQSIHQLSDLVKKITLKDKIEESREFASDVESSLYSGLAKGNEGLKNRGVKKAPFVVLIGANMPSILAEISFVTNPKDASKLRQPEYRERVAESLYAGVARYENGLAAARFEPVQRASTR
jgi:N-acetylmuramoyl-L-alanine amidase